MRKSLFAFIWLVVACFVSQSAPEPGAASGPAGLPFDHFGNLRHEGSSLQTGVTIVILENVSRCLRNYANEHHKFPDGDLPKVLSTLRTSHFLGLDEDNSGAYHALFINAKEQLLDGWGHPIILTRSSDSTVVSLISPGENGVLDQGDPRRTSSDDVY